MVLKKFAQEERLSGNCPLSRYVCLIFYIIPTSTDNPYLWFYVYNACHYWLLTLYGFPYTTGCINTILQELIYLPFLNLDLCDFLYTVSGQMCTLKYIRMITIVCLQVSHERSNIGPEFHENIDTFSEAKARM